MTQGFTRVPFIGLLHRYGSNANTASGNVIGTGNYSPHPVNCILEGNEPLGSVTKRISQMLGLGRSKSEPLRTSGPKNLTGRKPSFISKTGPYYGPKD